MSSAFLKALPKAELHVHVEGTLEPEMMLAMAERNGVALPYPNIDAIRAAYDFSNLQDFLNLYYAGMAVLLTRDDFYDLTMAYLERAARDGVRHVELFFDPQAHTERGIELSTVMQALDDAIADAKQLGISVLLIPNILRHLPADDADRLYEQLLPYREAITGIGLDSSELGHPPTKFKAVFERAKADGLRLVAHAGEEGPPEYVWEALDELHVHRIDHGNRALEDAKLVATLRERQIPLTVCPLSNLKLKVIEHIDDHPLKRMLDAGLLATVNSDDPAYFGGYVNDNFAAIEAALSLSREDLVQLAKNSFTASFLPDSEKRRYLSEIDEVASA